MDVFQLTPTSTESNSKIHVATKKKKKSPKQQQNFFRSSVEECNRQKTKSVCIVPQGHSPRIADSSIINQLSD